MAQLHIKRWVLLRNVLEDLWGKRLYLKMLSSKNCATQRLQVSQAHTFVHVFIPPIWFSSKKDDFSWNKNCAANLWDRGSEAIHSPDWLLWGQPLRVSLTKEAGHSALMQMVFIDKRIWSSCNLGSTKALCQYKIST